MEYEIGRYSIDTPEQVSLEYGLAGIGSRFMAVFVDHLFQTVIVIGGVLLFGLIGAGVGATWGIALLILFVFLVNWGYFTIFETMWNGQTPGKKMVHVRVIKNSGRSVTVFEAMTRNFIRVIDSLPFCYLVGIIAMFADSKNRRLGDLAAGTLVVHEREETVAPVTLKAMENNASTAPSSGGAYDLSKLSVQDLELIETFLSRRYDIEAYARYDTATKLATMMREKLGIATPDVTDDEKFLETLGKMLRDTASFHR